MAGQIIRQKDGLLARYSTVVDDFTHVNLTEDAYIQYCVDCAREEAKEVLKDYVLPFDEIDRSWKALLKRRLAEFKRKDCAKQAENK